MIHQRTARSSGSAARFVHDTRQNVDVTNARGTDTASGAAPPSVDTGQLLWRQRSLVEQWLLTDSAVRYADRLMARRSGTRSGGELISEAWIRIQRVFDRRTEPYPALSTPENAVRFTARVLDNLSRELVRTANRRGETTLPDEITRAQPASDQVIDRMLLEQLLVVIGRRVRTGITCPQCDVDTVGAAALQLIHLVLCGHDGSTNGTNYLDRLLYEALDRVSGQPPASDAARRQRKARCGHCVTELLQAGFTELGVSL